MTQTPYSSVRSTRPHIKENNKQTFTLQKAQNKHNIRGEASAEELLNPHLCQANVPACTYVHHVVNPNRREEKLELLQSLRIEP